MKKDTDDAGRGTEKKENIKEERPSLKQALNKAARSMWMSFPILLGAILLVSLANTLIPKEMITRFFSSIPFLDAVIGSGVGSVLAGNPITSYVLGGELLAQGVSLAAVTAFIVAWVTVGLVQLPAESMLLGKRFAITRNIASFVFAIIVAYIMVGVVSLI